MSDEMKPVSFEHLLKKYLTEYRKWRTLEGVCVYDNEDDIPVGPAAGPHTQLAQNIVTSYAAGARYIELKTIQVLEGSVLGIKKPCIYVKDQVYNTEWSTELSVQKAAEEYMKAYLLIFVLAKEFQLKQIDKIHFVCSVGYDLKGIQSEKVDSFLEMMKHANATEEWKKDTSFILEHLDWFENVSKEDLQVLSDQICDTVTLSTMHGCRADEIESIAKYLLEKKKFNTYVKMNPTLLGSQKVREILDYKGYQDISFDEEIFVHDLSVQQAVTLLENCSRVAKENHLVFGVKMTNTFPVQIQNEELEGETMYLSGKALYPLAINAAQVINKRCPNLPISYSGGADENNIVDILSTGIKPVTVSSILLKPGGYKNITKLIKKASQSNKEISENIASKELEALAKTAVMDERYDEKKSITFASQEEYDPYCSKCHNCEDVCPNRANIRLVGNEREYVVHLHDLCNECGCCMTQCIMGHIPYLEKYRLTQSSNQELFSLAIEQGKI